MPTSAGAVRTAVEYLGEHPDADVVYGEGWWIDESGAVISRYPTLPFDAKVLERDCFICQPSAFLRTLHDAGALGAVLPELEALYGVPQRAEHHPEVDTGVHQEMVSDMAARLADFLNQTLLRRHADASDRAILLESKPSRIPWATPVCAAQHTKGLLP